MKKGFKILLITLIFTILCSFGAVAYAEEWGPQEEGDDTFVTESKTAENDTAEPNAEETDLDKTGAEAEESKDTNTPNGKDELTDTQVEKNGFAMIYEALFSHASELLSALSLLATLVIGYFYKRGLIPSVKGVLGGISGTVGRMKESADKEIEARRIDSEKLGERLTELSLAIESQGKTVESLEGRLISAEEYQKQKERLNLLLNSQVDMLYNIFISSSLPQYQKDAMSSKINEMRKELESYE